ncbi:hypothetical protein BGX29_000050 [Mortierella sp. GBA35]|nr:hypothetical protein BGX29_000050 [Mortierella sp. GBA35]
MQTNNNNDNVFDNNNDTKGPKQLLIRLYTHNIRYATSNPSKNELPWSERAHLVLASIRLHALHNPQALICLQEVLFRQLLDILEGLGPEWAHIGVGRDDGKKAGEFSPILFRHSVWTIQVSRTIWLSPTPDQPSKGWDASNKRILTSALLRHWETGMSILALNTHLDDQGTRSRLESVKAILSHIASQERSLPIFLAGDFNSTPHEEAYKLLASETMFDLRNAVGRSLRYGHDHTFTGFEGREVDQKRIDFLFLNKHAWTIHGYGVLETRFEDGVFSSDHRPVVGDVALPL